MFEAIEPRMLLSGVPAGFVEVGSYTIDTGSATPVMTADLTPGVKHIAVVSGTFKVGGPSSHIADAEYHQRGPTKAWNDLTTLTGHNTDMGLDDASGRLVHWGPHEADAEYEQEFTPTTSAPLELFYQDVEGQGPNGAGSTWYDDNVGNLTVKLWRESLPQVSIEKIADGSEGTFDGTYGPSEVKFKVTRTGDSVGDLTVLLNKIDNPNGPDDDGIAKSGVDYSGWTGSVVIPDGESSKIFELPVIDDGIVEPSELLTVSIAPSNTYEIASAFNESVASIQDNDVNLQVEDVSMYAQAERVLEVSVVDHGGTATPGVHLTAVSTDPSLATVSWVNDNNTTDSNGTAFLRIVGQGVLGATTIVLGAPPPATGPATQAVAHLETFAKYRAGDPDDETGQFEMSILRNVGSGGLTQDEALKVHPGDAITLYTAIIDDDQVDLVGPLANLGAGWKKIGGKEVVEGETPPNPGENYVTLFEIGQGNASFNPSDPEVSEITVGGVIANATVYVPQTAQLNSEIIVNVTAVDVVQLGPEAEGDRTDPNVSDDLSAASRDPRSS